MIGPELLSVPWEDKPNVLLYDLWGQILAQQRGIEELTSLGDSPLLYSVANQLSIELPADDLAYDIDHIIRDKRWPLPVSLRLLAEIHDFPLYITTTIDHLMCSALTEISESKEAPIQIRFELHGKESSNDLPIDFSLGKRPTVFHLFGATCTNPDGFAATEDALIEFS